MIPKNAGKECRELEQCVLREYKGYRSCEQAGSCLLADPPTVDLNQPVLRCPKCGSWNVELLIPQ